jgi:hypothetical protein
MIDCMCIVAMAVPCCTLVGVYTPSGVMSSTSKSKAPKCLNDKTCNKNGKADYHYMVDCPHAGKDSAANLLAKHRAAKADRPKDAFKKIEPAKKVGRVLFKAKNTSLSKMARVEGKPDGKTIIGVLDTSVTSSAVARSFVTTPYKKKGTWLVSRS